MAFLVAISIITVIGFGSATAIGIGFLAVFLLDKIKQYKHKWIEK